ncbi:hypothetical protein [Planomonospora venezuelensis]|uniref:PknH-like extracellular domain-containing protein n=1 Tax=Planomonospora venezuelensis TaxID=1999 RepID=A0A841D1F1_PLAVE|nr:hypothetical protein [Planomonospora venezuelensis]MBB5964492.1 hypothetical protein [Planomonospora venezuelensis]GIN04227.1 hypothetical protein Pve01_58850 [Planomonospora venezuelensis]
MTWGIRAVALTAACAVLGGAAAGCGSGATIYAEAEARTELDRLSGLLREAEGLPEGFSAQPREGWRPPFRPADRDCRRVLDEAGGASRKRAQSVRASATYHGDGLGELAGVVLTTYPGQGAEARFDDLAEALEGCPAATDPAGGGTALAASGLELAEIGDGTAARRLRGRLNGYPYEMHVVFVRSGRTLVSLVHTAVAGADAGRTERLARFFADRVAE